MHTYTPWNEDRALAELTAVGCGCPENERSISRTDSQVEGDIMSYKATHRCTGCGKSVKEVADPHYVMPPDVDR